MWKVKMCSFTIPCIVCQWQQWFSNNAVFFSCCCVIMRIVKGWQRRIDMARLHGLQLLRGSWRKSADFNTLNIFMGHCIQLHIFWIWPIGAIPGPMFREWVWIFKNVSGKHLDNIMLSGLRLYLPCYLRIVFVFVFLEKCMPLTSW